MAILPRGMSSRLRAINRRRLRNKQIRKWRKEGSQKPPPHAVKQAVIEEYRKHFGIRVLVETGTYYGDMVMALKESFDRIYSIELGMDLWSGAVKRFQAWPHIEILQGESGKVLVQLMQRIDSPVLFWLDGHYSSGVTALGDKVCPIFQELDAIFSNTSAPHVLLIDDARLFEGDGDYPSIQELEQYVRGKDPGYKMKIEDDVIRFNIPNQHIKKR